MLRFSLALGATLASLAVGCIPSSPAPDDQTEPSRAALVTIPDEGTVDLAHDEAAVYFTTVRYGGEGGIYRLEKGTRTPIRLASETNPRTIALDESFVYYTANDRREVHRVAKRGGAVEVLATDKLGNGFTDVAVSGDFVFAGTPGGLARMKKDGSEAELVTPWGLQADCVVADGDHVFWLQRANVDGQHEAGGLFSMPIFASRGDASQVKRLADGPNFSKSWEVALGQDEGHLYFPDGTNAKVYSVDKKSGEIVLLAEGLDRPLGIAVDGDDVFFAQGAYASDELDPRKENEARKILRAPAAGGKVDVVADTRFAAAYALDVDGDVLRWTTYSAGLYETKLERP